MIHIMHLLPALPNENRNKFDIEQNPTAFTIF